MGKAARWCAGALGVVLTLSGCSGGGTGAGGVGSGGKGGKVELSYAAWDNNQKKVLEQLGREFTGTHPNVTVKVQLTPWTEYFNKLKTSVTGGSAPDVFWMNGPYFRLYASNGVIRPLDKEVAEDKVDLSVYPKALIDLYTYEGELYGLPKDMDTIGVWYNKALFDARGVDHPAPDWTWSDFNRTAAELTDPGKGVYGVAAQLTSFQEYQYNTIAQAGGYVISPDGKKSGYDQPETIKGLEFWTDLIEKKHSPDLQTMTDTSPLQLFEAGKLAMYWGGSWNAGEFSANEYTKDKVDVAPLPRGEKRATVIHGVANVVSATTEHPREAWEFVEFLGSERAALAIGRSGPLPARDGTRQAWVKDHPRFALTTFLDAVDYAVPFPVSENTAAWNEAELTHLTQAWTGERTVGEASAELARAMNDLLARE
ncbi:ABC transporter substrate-binding protein [Streptomyces sp. NRRL F-5135]|uniref:ABC transporter substrate-binding protein n=1 Tax=Streptomyces sp. NRRL F-5135 TaxID=1463858 RepID=UPI0004C571B5|nr:sugar ABC transporter substrate-binding protein [Streptomyces sp. NRRL F-5135]